jgi:Uma2 family endonuclease
LAQKHHTLEEYFAFCEKQEGRFEFVNGVITEMESETVTAGQITSNVFMSVRGKLDDEPLIFVQNAVRLEVQRGKIFRIPNFMILKETGNLVKYATEPLLIVEVLSESTAKIDRSTKLNEYRLIPSLQYYLIVDQESCLVETYIRESDRWYVEFHDKMAETISLPFFGIDLPLKAIYKKISF